MNKLVPILLGLTIAIAAMFVLREAIPLKATFFVVHKTLNIALSNYISLIIPIIGMITAIIFLLKQKDKTLVIVLLIVSLFDVGMASKSKIFGKSTPSSGESKALYRALDHNDTQKVLTLLDNGANPNGMFHPTMTNLDQAIQKNNIKTLKALIKHGVNINFTSKHGDTALSFATALNRYEMVKILLESGANPNIKTSPPPNIYPHNKVNYGRTPIFVAVEKNYYQVAKLLLSYKASTTIKDLGNKTVFDFVKDDKMEALLKEYTR